MAITDQNFSVTLSVTENKIFKTSLSTLFGTKDLNDADILAKYKPTTT